MKLCESCKRHIREAVCPFCAATLSRELPRQPSSMNLSRAALVAGAVVVAACGTSHGDEAEDSGMHAEHDSAVIVQDSAVHDTGTPEVDSGIEDSGQPDVGDIALYGGPPLEDAGPQDAGFAVQPAYGLPIDFDAGNG